MSDEQRIRTLVREAVYRAVGRAPRETRRSGRALVTARDVESSPPGGSFHVPPGALVTPLARQVAMERRITLLPAESAVASGPAVSAAAAAEAHGSSVALGADHAGFELKQAIKRYLTESGYSVIDCGTDSTAAVDYPDIAFAVARQVADGAAWRGILVDGAGIGSCMAANKVPGVRAAMCYDEATVVNSRKHNDANVLTLGAGIGPDLARRLVRVWLETPAHGGRHARRVGKIMDIERRFMRAS